MAAMQITVDISEDFATRAEELGLTPETYAYELLAPAAPQSWNGKPRRYRERT